jgi:AcrR family transcriptional regulator
MTVAVPKTSLRGRRGNFSNRREEVLRAAARVFSVQGFRHATLEDVAGALNMTRPALYHYASSKDELVADCASRAHEELREAIADARRHRTGREQLVAFFRRYAEIICDDFGRCFVLVNRRELDPDGQRRNIHNQRELDVAVREMLQLGVSDGSLRPVSPEDGSRLLFAAFNGIPQWYRPNGSRTIVKIADDFLALVLSGLAP